LSALFSSAQDAIPVVEDAAPVHQGFVRRTPAC